MNETQRAAAERLADELQRFDGAERESLRDETTALLRELLAAEPVVNQQMTTEPAQEPVAWVIERGGIRELTFIPPRGNWDNVPGFKIESLYAAPQQRKPLTELQIDRLDRQAIHGGPDSQYAFRFTRLIERAHGITGEQE